MDHDARKWRERRTAWDEKGGRSGNESGNACVSFDYAVTT